MRIQNLKTTLKTAVFLAITVLFGAVPSFCQQTINLSAGPTTANLPDGSVVPMWGYSCGTAAAGSTATCAKLNPAASWSPVMITVPTGQGLTINLTNGLSFANGNTVPTSMVIVGQLGGGLGDVTQRTTTPSPVHPDQVVTWSTVGNSSGPQFVPPPQGQRVQSFATEVGAGATTSLTWSAPRPGTYLIESGTHPSIQGPMGLYGILVVTSAPAGSVAGTAYPVSGTGSAVTYNAEVSLLLSEIDPVQNNAVNTAVNTAGFSETKVWSGQPGGCGNPSSPLGTINTCYPPAVNYTPTYYLINGVAFNKTNAAASQFTTSPAIGLTPGTGNVLVRLVNAGLRMHVPAIVGSQTAGRTGAGSPTTVTGFQLIAEDGNPLPGLPRVQNEVFMAAGKTYDVMVNVPATAMALPVYDRELSLSGNAIDRDAGMLAYISINGGGLPTAPELRAAIARADVYNSLIAGHTLTVSDPAKGVIANDTNVYGVQLLTPPTQGTLTLNANGTFTYVPAGMATSDSFVYEANGNPAITATVTLGPEPIENARGITVKDIKYKSNLATTLSIKPPGVLSVDSDAEGYPLSVALPTVHPVDNEGLAVTMDANGGFNASVATPGTYKFTYKAQNSQGTTSARAATVTLVFPEGSGLAVTVLDGNDRTTTISDYRWIIEEDRTFYIDPKCSTNPPPAGCSTAASGGEDGGGGGENGGGGGEGEGPGNGLNPRQLRAARLRQRDAERESSAIVPTLGVNFHTSYMPYVAQGCTGPYSCEGGQTIVDPATGTHGLAVCDLGNGVCRPDNSGYGKKRVLPSQVVLDPTKRYYISVLPGDAANPFYITNSKGHGMGGAPITFGQTAVTVMTQPSPYPPGKLSVFVFEDDFPLNGEHDSGGGAGPVNSNNEPGLGGFQIHLWDAMGGNGDFTGQMTYDMFNQPLSNSLAGTLDPLTGKDACPISAYSRVGTIPDPNNSGQFIPDPTQTGITGMIVTCPTFESDGVTPSPLAGQAVIANLMPGRWGVIATPAADRIARGEEWHQTNTLDGQKAHDVFTRIGEPSYFQEFGPAGYHVSIGFANPAIINARKASVCGGTDPNITGQNCTNTITGRVTGERLSRTPDERLYSSGSHDAFYWTQCYVSFGDPDGEDFAFTKCNADGSFTLSGLPDGDWRITTFDQWNDQLVDGLSTPIRLDHTKPDSGKIGDISATQWQANLYTRTFIDDNKDGISQSTEAGIPFANVAVRLRDGSLENLLVTDFTGTANFNETFPLFSWYTVETDTTRYKNTGIHVVYDAGGPADGSSDCGKAGYPPCGNSAIGKFLANTAEKVSVPVNLRLPGAVYCKDADCSTHGTGIRGGPESSDAPSSCSTSSTGVTTCSTILSTGRIDPPWVGVEGWQGFPGQNSFLEFGKTPYVVGENGGIKGHVIYASTRPFDDPRMLVQTQWEPLVPHVTINLYQEGSGSDGVSSTLKLVDTTKTSSWDDWAQGFRSDGVPNMNCPGQGASTGAIPDLFFFSLYNQPSYLDWYNNVLHGQAESPMPLPSHSQYKCLSLIHI